MVAPPLTLTQAPPDRLGPALAVFFRHASPRVLTLAVLGSLAARVLLGHWSLWDLAIPLAIVAFWPLQEWLIHVFILHYQPVTVLGRKLDFKVPILHRAHHRDPWKLDLVFIPIHVFAFVPLVVGGVALLGASRPELVAIGVLAYFALSLHYEWVHFMIHTLYRPRLGYYQRLARNHLLHHFRNEHYWYGVTMLRADGWMHTAPEPNAVPKSTTCLSILPQAGS
jgi:hypothetical protein